MRMLIVDDEESIRDFLRAFFEGRFEVEAASSAEDALGLLVEKTKFDVMMVDKNLPGMSGIEFIRHVRDVDDDVSILMITGYASAESIVETLNLGVDAYVEKPFDSLEELGNLVDAIVGRKSLAAEPARDLTRPPLVVAAIAEGDGRARVEKIVGEIPAAVTSVGTEAELLAALSPEPDVVILDSDAWRNWGPETVQRVNGRAPGASCIVLSTGRIPTEALKKLVALGVSAIVMWKTDPFWEVKLRACVRPAEGWRSRRLVAPGV